MILTFSSFGFGLCAFLLRHEYMYLGLLIPLTQTSILHHAHGTDSSLYLGGKFISSLDILLAHAVTVKSTLDAYSLGLKGVPVYSCVVYVTCVYYSKIKGQRPYIKGERPWWHFSTHVVSQLGLIYLALLKHI